MNRTILGMLKNKVRKDIIIITFEYHWHNTKLAEFPSKVITFLLVQKVLKKQ